MSTRSLNKVILIGNLTRDPELRYTPMGAAVCTLGLATNRSWTTDTGEKKEEVEYHRLVAWNKLAELCSQLLAKGRKIYIEGRLQTRSWTGNDGQQRQTTEIVMDDMIILDSKRVFDENAQASKAPQGNQQGTETQSAHVAAPATVHVDSSKKGEPVQMPPSQTASQTEEVNVDDIPF